VAVGRLLLVVLLAGEIMLRNRIVHLGVTIVALTSMVWVQTVALAEDRIAVGAAAAKTTSIPGSEDLFSVDANGTMTLWPSGGKPTTLSAGDVFPGATGTNTNAIQGIYGDNTAMTNAGTAAHGQLKTENSRTGDAYRTLTGSLGASKPSLTNDPLWNQSDDTWSGLSSNFADCSKVSTYSNSSIKSHIPDYKTCERVADETRNCTLLHAYKAGIINYVSGPMNLASCGDGCLYIWIGSIGDDYWEGDCSIFEESISVDVFNPNAVKSATLEYAKWDDYLQVYINDNKVWSGPDGNFPPETVGSCELSTSWEVNPGVDVSGYFRKKGALKFKTRTSVTGHGEGYARIKVIFDPTKILTEDKYSPPDCEKSTKGLADNFCTGTYQCLDMPAADGDGCAIIDGIKMCESMMSPIHPGLSPLCRKATISAKCDFYRGQMDCWTDPNGNKQCPTNNGDNLESCSEFESDGACGYVKSSCLEGASGASGQCYVHEETWDCGTDVNVPTATKTTSVSCPGSIHCMGTECVSPTATQSGDFARAAATLQAARFMAMDADCGNGNVGANQTCSIFKGEAGKCKKAVGGIVNCCKSASTVSLGDYITLILAVGKIDSAMSALDKSSALRGAWETLSDPVNDAWSEIQKPFVEGWENIWGGTEDVASDAASKTILGSLQQTLVNKVGEWTAQAFGDAAANSLFSVVGSNGSAFVGGAAQGPLQLGGGAALVGTALSWIMTAYTIYQIVMILIQLIWSCEKKEFELNAKRQLKNCTSVGSYCETKILGICLEKRESYCCFNSPLSRILQEQIRPQLGMDFGTAKHPSCDGLTTDQIQAADWSKVNLDEWLGILASTGHLPTTSSVNINALTGTGTTLDTGGRTDAADRAMTRVGNINVDKSRQNAASSLASQPLP